MARAEPLQLAALTPAVGGDPGMPPVASEIDCLALNIYWEARAEPRLGQVAVAEVTLNRVADPAFPDTVCAVVRQGEERGRNLCQFSWHCDGLDDRPRNPMAWQHARQLARLVLAGQPPDPTGGALWFHSDRVHPDWAADMTRIGRIGTHVFYRLAGTAAGRSSSLGPPDPKPSTFASASDQPARRMAGAALPLPRRLNAASSLAPLSLADADSPCADQRSVAPEPPELAVALATSSPQQLLSLVEELRLGDDRPPCQDKGVRDAPTPVLMLASDLPTRPDADPFEAILTSDGGLADAGVAIAGAAPWLSRPFEPASGRGGALTPRGLRPDWAPVAATTVEVEPAPPATRTPIPPEPRAAPPGEAHGPAGGLLAASLRVAEAVMPRLPELAPAELLRALEPPALLDRLPPRPF